MSPTVWRTLPLVSGGPKVASTMAALGEGRFDGQSGRLRIGSGINTTSIPLIWDEARGKWVGDEKVVIRNSDQNGPTLGGGGATMPGAALTSKQYFGLRDQLANTPNFWGSNSLPHIGEAIRAGLKLEYWHHAWLLPDTDNSTPYTGSHVPINVGAMLYQYNPGDIQPQPSVPIQNGWAETGYLQSHSGANELEWTWHHSEWQPLLSPGGGALAPMTKDAIFPMMVGFMQPGATGPGYVIDYALWLRYVS